MLSLGLGYPRAGTAYHVLWFLNQERYITKLPSSSPSLNIQGQGEGATQFLWPLDMGAFPPFSIPSIFSHAPGERDKGGVYMIRLKLVRIPYAMQRMKKGGCYVL